GNGHVVSHNLAKILNSRMRPGPGARESTGRASGGIGNGISGSQGTFGKNQWPPRAITPFPVISRPVGLFAVAANSLTSGCG
ncbi:MAG: hypothetical protein Q7T73_19520, partial [Beijerinckiaceae bacterium]|nr:hypothetical protein [Beijerinckiaceae bacterium]